MRFSFNGLNQQQKCLFQFQSVASLINTMRIHKMCSLSDQHRAWGAQCEFSDSSFKGLIVLCFEDTIFKYLPLPISIVCFSTRNLLLSCHPPAHFGPLSHLHFNHTTYCCLLFFYFQESTSFGCPFLRSRISNGISIFVKRSPLHTHSSRNDTAGYLSVVCFF